MYNEQLEQLIDAALADGELTEKEKQVLFKKALALGVDLDEFEMVLDARLVKLKKADEEKAASSAPKSNKFGDVKKCPACGAIVQSYQGVCPECGYAFENIEANSSSQRFSEMLDKMTKEDEEKSTFKKITQTYAGAFTGKGNDTRIHAAIRNFPVPNTKADLMEFIITMKTKMSDNQSLYADAYRTKYKECIDKARMLFPHDKDLAPFLEEDKKMGWWKSKSQRTKMLIIGIAIWIVLLAIILPITLSYSSTDSKVKSENSKEITTALKTGDTQEAVKLFLASDETDKKLAGSIVDACLSEENLDDAMRIASSVEAKYDDIISTKLYDYYINHGEYEKAKGIYQTAYNHERFNGKYIKDVVVSLCESGKKKEAERFLNIHKDEITKNDELGRPKKVINDISSIIESY
jgi:uncharacterized Zn finger protein (UPF0148 family)